MKNKNKIKFRKIVLWLLDIDRFQAVMSVLIIIIFAIFLKDKLIGEDTSIIDLSFFTSLLALFLLNRISKFISKILKHKLEDSSKVDIDYSALVSRYSRCNKFVKYSNPKAEEYNFKCKLIGENKTSTSMNGDGEYVFPITLEMLIDSKNISIVDNNSRYELPEIIKSNYNKIMEAHINSNVYNQLNIRVDSINKGNDEITLYTSRTTYFDSLATNRSIDYKWGNLLSNRELLSPGPMIESLSDSLFSNHLGFNAYVETSDHKIIFVERGKMVSIGKNTLGSSIGASLKTKYALNSDFVFDEEGLIKGIKKEIKDELRIEENEYEFELKENIIAIYRDICEGGKPQFLVYLKVKKESIEVKKRFNEYKKQKANKKSNRIKKMEIDGNKLTFFDVNELDDLYITPDLIVYKNKAYDVVPSVSGTLVMLIDYLKKIN